jgi:hypothetical protein
VNNESTAHREETGRGGARIPESSARDARFSPNTPEARAVAAAGRRRRNKGNSKLTIETVLAIRREYAAGGVMQRELATRYGVTQLCISLIVTGARWAWAGGEIREPLDRGAKLNPELVRNIRREYAAGGVTQLELGARYGVGESSIYAVVTGRTWLFAGGEIHERTKASRRIHA